MVTAGQLPFIEDDAAPVLRRVLDNGTFSITTDPSVVGRSAAVIVVVGTPIDEHLNPDPDAVLEALRGLIDYLRAGQLLILRSTVYSGVTRKVIRYLSTAAPGLEVAFCPERIAQAKAMTELLTLPQRPGGNSHLALSRFSAAVNLLDGRWPVLRGRRRTRIRSTLSNGQSGREGDASNRAIGLQVSPTQRR